MISDFEAFVGALPDTGGTVHVTTGPVAEIVLDDPRARNALTPHMMVALRRAVDAAVAGAAQRPREPAGARVIVIRGASGSFCAGGNLVAVRDHLLVPGMGRAMGVYMHATLRRLAEADALVLGVLEGAAIGGGAELLTACDRVFAAPGARVGWTQARLGVSPGFGGGARLVRRVGAARALDVLLSPALLSAEEALAVGLVDEVAEAPIAAAQRYADQALALDPAALRGVKALLRAVARPTEAEAAAELDVFAGLWGAPPHAQAVTAGGRKGLERPREPAGPSRA